MGTTQLDSGRRATRTGVCSIFQYPFPHHRATCDTPHHKFAKFKLVSAEDGTE